MRYAVIALSVLAAVSAFGQVRVSAFRTGPDNGWGGAVEIHATPHWAVELAAAKSGNQQLTIGGLFTGHVVEFRTTTLDLTAHYYFANSTRWQPFIGAGAHRATTSSDEVEDRTSAEIDGGVHFMITPRFSLFATVRGILNDDHSYDSSPRLDLGVAWRF